jgi:TPR repeat protein
MPSRWVRFGWLAIKKSQPPPAAPALTEPKAPIDHPRISAELAETMMARGQGLLNAGDIGDARILFERLADAGVADGAFALAKAYDPDYLASNHVIGLAGDAAKAQALYRRAMQMGSAEAGRLVE